MRKKINKFQQTIAGSIPLKIVEKMQISTKHCGKFVEWGFCYSSAEKTRHSAKDCRNSAIFKKILKKNLISTKDKIANFVK